jgi:hypothetical protein
MNGVVVISTQVATKRDGGGCMGGGRSKTEEGQRQTRHVD